MAQPERLRELVDANIQKKHIVIDEIQKLPELLEVVHQLIERKSGQQFILTGSSARKLRRQGVNLNPPDGERESRVGRGTRCQESDHLRER